MINIEILKSALTKIIAWILSIVSAFGITIYSNEASFEKETSSETEVIEKAEIKADELINIFFSNTKKGFADESYNLAREVLKTVIIQIMTSKADSEKVSDAIDSLPVYNVGERDTTRENLPSHSKFNILIEERISSLIENSSINSSVKSFLMQFTTGINDLYVYFIPTDSENIYEFHGDYVSDSGEIVEVYTGVYYDMQTKLVYGKNNDGIFSIGYDYDVKHFLVINPTGAWMRKYGYNIFYDVLGDIIFMDCDTARVKFNYSGKECMIQFWKGNYTSLTNGAEIGVYFKKDGSLLQYECADDDNMLNMSMALYDEDEMLFERENVTHWWISGFQAGMPRNHENMIMKASIKFNNNEMPEAFLNAVSSQYGERMTAEKDGMIVNILWK